MGEASISYLNVLLKITNTDPWNYKQKRHKGKTCLKSELRMDGTLYSVPAVKLMATSGRLFHSFLTDCHNC